MWPGVIAKDKEACSVRAKLGQRESVHNGTHRMLADAEMEILPAQIISLEVSSPFIVENGLVRWSKIRRPSEKPGNVLSQNIQRFARGIAPSDSFRIRCEHREVAIPTGREFAPLHQFDLGLCVRILSSISCKQFGPFPSSFCAACAYTSRETFVDAIGNEERFVLRPTVRALAKADLVVSKRLAVRRRSILFVG